MSIMTNGISRKALTSSSGVKSLTMLNSLRISSGVFPLIMLATVLHPTSLKIGGDKEVGSENQDIKKIRTAVT
jgi:hypothetical protein